MKHPALATSLALLLVPGLAVADGEFTLSTGASHSTGTYGSDITTDISTLAVTARYDAERWNLSASLPWLRVSGDPNVLPGTGPVLNLNPLGRGRLGLVLDEPQDDFGSRRGAASGAGDVTLRAGYALASTGPVLAELSTTVKLATADEDKGLGTGANDYGVALDVSREWDRASVFGGVSYTRLGDTDFIAAADVLGANLGTGWRAGRGQLGLVYDFRESASSSFDDRSEVTGFYSVNTARGNPFQVYVLAGLSEGSPDWGTGVSYGWKF